MRFDCTQWQGPRPADLGFIRQMMEIYRNLLLQTGGDVDEALRRMAERVTAARRTSDVGHGGERLSETRPDQFGDDRGSLDPLATLSNAVCNRGIDKLRIEEEGLKVCEHEHFSSAATVLMVDVNHSMVLYGEDRITPARKIVLALIVLALAHLMETR